MQQIPILHTKLYIPPLRPERVARPRLVGRLDEGLRPDHRLTLVSAPAGFGKTTLAAEWAAGCGRPAAWLSLDEGENDPARFLVYLVAAVQTVAPQVGDGVLAALHAAAPPPPVEALLAALLNDLTALPDRLLLVLDDYHVIDAEPVDNAVTFLLEHLPPQMHLVVATREDPNLPLARLRARGQMTELRAADLRFTPSEAAEFLNRVMGLGLSAEDIAALETRTEGWIAGLQLTALSMQGRADIAGFIQAFTGSHRFVLDYLVEEVLQHQSEPIRRFLLHTAMLDRLCGPLCDAVTEREGSQGMLEALDRGNLFVVPLDGERRWYRYHPLFAEVLQAHLAAEQPERVPALHRRASAWYEQHEDPPGAIRHALAAQDFERAASLIERAWPAMDLSYQSATWLGWVKALPDELVRARPVLSLGYGWALLDGGELEAAEAWLRDAERGLEPAPGVNEPPEPAGSETGLGHAPQGEGSRRRVVADQALFRSLPASIATARAYRAQALGDLPGTVRHARRALELTPEEDPVRRVQATALLGLACWAGGDLEAAGRAFVEAIAIMHRAGRIADAISTTHVLAEIRMAQGRLREALGIYRQSLPLAAEQGGPTAPGTAELYRGMGELHCERGDLEAAAQHLLAAEKLGAQVEVPGWRHRLCVARARLQQAQGDLDGALDLLDEAERFSVRTPLPDVRPVAAWRARIWLAQGRLSQALGWARERGLSAGDELSYLREFEHITLARALIARYRSERAEGAIHEAMGLLDRLLQAAEEGGRMGSAIEILVLQALAHQARGSLPAALVPLARALALAGAEGYVQIFADEGPPLAALLREAAKQGIALPDAGRLPAVLGEAEGRGPRPQPLIEPLSERELDVLRLLRTELSGPEIARELVVSLNTVRTHTKHIYGKLGVNSRRAAVRRAEELGLV